LNCVTQGWARKATKADNNHNNNAQCSPMSFVWADFVEHQAEVKQHKNAAEQQK
jgi:hypothetical protein